MQHIKKWGLPQQIINKVNQNELDSSEIARVTAVHKERYLIESENGKANAEITGNLRYSTESSLDFPAVGDWVKIIKMDENNAIILEVLPRSNSLKRKASGKATTLQMIASNIDVAFVCMALDQNYNLNRIDRYLAICLEEGVEAQILLTKSDLLHSNEVVEKIKDILKRHPNTKVLALSLESSESLKKFDELFEPAKTYCFLGSSGVGKSTLVNRSMGSEEMKINAISDSNLKGQHTTTHRELFLLPNGSLVIDSPGMRELGMGHAEVGLHAVFDQISQLANQCKYQDCTHTTEPACAILAGLGKKIISEDAYNNFIKLKKEQAYFSEKETEKKQKGKHLSKLIREYNRIKKSNH